MPDNDEAEAIGKGINNIIGVSSLETVTTDSYIIYKHLYDAKIRGKANMTL